MYIHTVFDNAARALACSVVCIGSAGDTLTGRIVYIAALLNSMLQARSMHTPINMMLANRKAFVEHQ
jgi:hypothetical protein